MMTPHPASIWAKTSAIDACFPVLEKDYQTDVVIIGGGFTGLSASHFLAERGVDTAVVEAHDIGWGASGRNGGIAVPRYKKGYATLASRYGNEVTLDLYRLLLRALDDIAAIAEHYQIDCDLEPCGHLTPAHSKAAMSSLTADVEWLQQEAGDTAPRILDAQETAEQLGTKAYVGAYLDPRGCGIHPFDYARGLAVGLQARGARVFTGTEVVAVDGLPDGVVVRTGQGTIRASRALIATNAYTPLTSGFGNLARRVVPVSSSIVATVPLSERQLKSVLPGRRVVSDSKRIMYYYQLIRGNRLLFGGRGDITGRRDDPGIYRPLESTMREFFSEIVDVPIEARWSGKVAVTLDSLPHIGQTHERIAYAMGYGGRGVVLTHALGRALADAVCGEQRKTGPLGDDRFRPIPLHSLRIPGMQMAAAWYRLQDRLGR